MSFHIPTRRIHEIRRETILNQWRLRGKSGMVAYLQALWSLSDHYDTLASYERRGMLPGPMLRAKTRALVTFDRRITGRAYLP